MRWRVFPLILLTLQLAQAAQFNGERALADVQRAVAFGPRPAGSVASQRMLAWLKGELRTAGWAVEEDRFIAVTPVGKIAMTNLIARRSGISGHAVVVSGHTDTKRFPFRFVGANDGGSSTAILLELARALKDVALRNDTWLVFLDGEEAVGDWTGTDSVYGSRHLAAKWAADGTMRRVDAVINVDMTGDRDLHLLNEYNSTPALRRILRAAAARTGHAGLVAMEESSIDDDHMPFLRQGFAAIDLIDFDYGPRNAWWHSKDDTVDKLSATSLKTTGDVVVEMLRLLEPGALSH